MSCRLAGSAIAQGSDVGRLDRWLEWKPTSIETKWLLLSGASNPPRGITISDRRTRDTPGTRGGTFLSGVAHDLANMEDAVGSNLFNTVKDLYLTKSTACRHIRSLFDACRRDRVKPILYYTGHGEIGTGNWCFSDGTISIQEILDMLGTGGTYYPMIFSDACYSGHWANFCLEKDIAGFHCLAACMEYSKAVDTKGEGGDLTLFMTGKKRRPRPSTEPLYSGGNRREFPITTGYDSVDCMDFVASRLLNSQKILICQDFYNGRFSGCFAPSKKYSPRPAVSWEIERNFDSFFELVKEHDNGKSYIYSLACDENLGFAAFFMEKYGTAQEIVTNLSDIEKKWQDGFEITSSAALGSSFYIVMTKGTGEYRGKRQMVFAFNTWNDTYDEIDEQHKAGYTVTGICYSTGRKKYFVVMTKIPEVQSSHYFDDTDAALNWMEEQHHVAFHPTIIFTIPTFLNKTLVVMTTDENRSGYEYAFGYKLE